MLDRVLMTTQKIAMATHSTSVWQSANTVAQFLLCKGIVLFVTLLVAVHAYAAGNPTGVSQEFRQQILVDASKITQALLERKETKNAVIEHWSMGWGDAAVQAHYWRATPVVPAKGVLLFINGTTVDDLESKARRFAEEGYLFLGLSWAELIPHYDLFSGEAKREVLLKAASCALFLANSIPPRDAAVPFVLQGSSNGGIIATLVNELAAKPFDGILYYTI